MFCTLGNVDWRIDGEMSITLFWGALACGKENVILKDLFLFIFCHAVQTLPPAFCDIVHSLFVCLIVVCQTFLFVFVKLFFFVYLCFRRNQNKGYFTHFSSFFLLPVNF